MVTAFNKCFYCHICLVKQTKPSELFPLEEYLSTRIPPPTPTPAFTIAAELFNVAQGIMWWNRVLFDL